MKKNKQITIKIFDQVGKFAENKDTARTMRLEYILPALNEGSDLILDYSKVDSTTQSFTHALISDAIRTFGPEVFDKISFKNCSESVKRVVGIVAEYMQRKTES